MITFIAIATLVASMFLMMGSLRDVARDTIQVVADAADQARSAGLLIRRVSFFVLWAMIFALSFY